MVSFFICVVCFLIVRRSTITTRTYPPVPSPTVFRSGQGAYMPSTSPTMVANGSEPSITASFTYYTDATRRDALLHRSHALMRKLKVTPPAVKPASLFDTTTPAIAARLSRAPEHLEFAEVLAS